MTLFLFTGWLLFIQMLACRGVKFTEICNFERAGNYSCRRLNRAELQKLDIPNNACVIKDCGECVLGKETFFINSHLKLFRPSAFILDFNQTGGISAPIYQCYENGVPCECLTRNCSGTAEFCKTFNCALNARCFCTTSQSRMVLRHIEGDFVDNPRRVTFDVCLASRAQVEVRSRKLLEYEEATFKENNITLLFRDPVVICPSKGKLVVRTRGLEKIFDVKDELQINIPFEFLEYPQELKLIFITPEGSTIKGSVYLTGKSICSRVSCFLCLDNFYQRQCWPPILAIIIYCAAVVIFCISMLILKLTIMYAWTIIKIIIQFIILSVRIVKSIARLCLLLGAFIGQSIHNGVHKGQQFLERNADPVPNSKALLLLAVLTISAAVEHNSFPFCNEQNVMVSELDNCHLMSDGSRSCKVSSTVELTFRNIDHTTCLWFQSNDGRELFQLNIKFMGVKCKFSTKREYFTFPVEMRTLSQLSCAQNAFCSWGYHCRKGARFEALTPEAESYPGFTNCVPSNTGSGCTIISRQSCLFYSVFWIPDLLQSYEVKSINGYQCSYEFSISHIHNNTKEYIEIVSALTTKSGIRIDILGALDQPQIFFKESLIQRVGIPEEAYLHVVSPSSRPMAGNIGQVQANSSFSKHFIFDEKIVNCDFFETTLRCSRVPDFLSSMIKTKEMALPLSRDMHALKIENGVLVSSLLASSPVKLSLQFQEYRVQVDVTNVCPQIKKGSAKTSGCYDCQILAVLKITLSSSCDEGLVTVEFVDLQIYTRTVFLNKDPRETVIQFMALKRCYAEKLCLRAEAMVQCEIIDFCLAEPSIELLDLNTSYTVSHNSLDNMDSYWHWLQFPTTTGIFFSHKNDFRRISVRLPNNYNIF